MKELLYLKDDQIKDCIQLLLYAYRETFSDPKDILKKNSMGAAHHRTLYLIERNEGISVNELLIKLKITKQSLNRVLQDLKKMKIIKQLKDNNDSRRKLLYLDQTGKKFYNEIFQSQKVFQLHQTHQYYHSMYHSEDKFLHDFQAEYLDYPNY